MEIKLAKKITFGAVLALAVFWLNAAQSANLDVTKQIIPPAYDYPIDNAYAATIITVPPEMKVDYHASLAPEEQRIKIFPDREIPEGFWYEREGLRYSQVLQTHPAPIVYVIAGTGADVRAEKMIYLAAILYNAGFNVVLLPSPTHPNFIINASANFITGSPQLDAVDLYKVIQVIDHEVSKKAQITGRMLTGYSLGAIDAAFTGKLDDELRVLNFDKVLLINPPYNLYNSVNRIDNFLYRALPNGVNDADSFIKGALVRLASVNGAGDALDFTNERLLLDSYNKYKPSDDRLATTIGLSFRLSAANMIFTSDVMSKGGYVFPRNQEFTTSTHLNDYLAVALRTGFKDYFNDVFIKYYQARYPGITPADLIAQSSLQSIARYIYGNKKIGLITNADDIILSPGDINNLSALFGNNAIIFDIGGHVGNMTHPTVAYYIVKFMEGGW